MRTLRDPYIYLSRQRDLERMKSSPFYGDLFSIYNGRFFESPRHWKELHSIIKEGMWVTVTNDSCCAVISKVYSVYHCNLFHEYRFTIEQYRDKTHNYDDVIEYFDEDTFNVIHPFKFSDVPETNRIPKDMFMTEFHKFMSSDSYVNDAAFMGLKTLYVNLGDDNKLDCTEHMEKALDRFDAMDSK